MKPSSTIELPIILKLLAHDVRWRIIQALAVSDYRVNELVTITAQPLNLVSYHLKQLRQKQLVTTRRSEADGRDTYYSLDLNHLRSLYLEAGAALHASLIPSYTAPIAPARMWRVLFVCTHNSARSQMAEGLLRHVSQGQVEVHSAGSEPSTIHPDAIHTMNTIGIDIRSQASKGFEAVLDQPFDVIITVCDRAREVCPVFPGDGLHYHWGFPDPSAVQDTQERQQAFDQIAHRLQSRIEQFLTHLTIGALN